MAETAKNFIYLLPDVAYIVELVKAKESEAFKVRDYLQINGNFMDENDILEESIKKLANRIQPKEYELVLPDFLFTNTMVNVQETGEQKVLEYVNAKIIPDLGISEETHELKAFVLNEFKGQARVQLSALEKSVLEPLRTIFPKDGDLKISSVLPLSWVTKSLIALEPSISVIQMGAKLYMAQHYIGIDQANDASVEDTEKIIESIKTLKGAEPSIQTVYLLANALVESKLNDGLKGTLPVQQLAKDSEESEMPSYIKQVVEAAIKSIEIKDYQVPAFNFSVTAVVADHKSDADEIAEKKTDIQEKIEAVLPPPTELGTTAAEDLSIDEATSKNEEKTEPEEEKTEESSKKIADEKTETAEATPELKKEEELIEETKSETVPQIDLRQFISEEVNEDEKVEAKKPEKTETVAETKTAEDKTVKEETKQATPEKKIIKNDTGINNMVKMVFVALVSFFITVGIGLGIGLGFLTFTSRQQTAGQNQPTPVAEVSPTLAPTVEPTLEPIDREKYNVLVVNATTKAGYAGEVANLLKEAGFTKVSAANAKGDYKEVGNYFLAAETDENLIKTLKTDTKLNVTFLAEKEVEDPANKYDFVLVLAE